jgi:hypothetical protein
VEIKFFQDQNLWNYGGIHSFIGGISVSHPVFSGEPTLSKQFFATVTDLL